jgi:hypothetical protein
MNIPSFLFALPIHRRNKSSKISKDYELVVNLDSFKFFSIIT